ncbi:flagellar filament capping protein FliD [Paenibacillus sp. GP183]|uniref:flagellar filament capping protein FliD n=1 Tax=Paenibacillus sp. GP183 TaxID=1882751 RepID=UPI0008948E74|nr:flagellar filament capping protein FliD [Paenibacillus sp. GP183]SEB56102.1 flagellar hook-associated protein 2 [Paenibacillus sp. GP183]
MINSIRMNPYLNLSALFSQLYPSGGAAAMPMPAPIGMAPVSLDAKAQSSALAGLTSQAKQLKTNTAPLDASSLHSVWNKRSVTSTASSSVSGLAADGAKKATYTVDVKQLAVAQQSAGTALTSTAVTNLAAGAHNFSITSGGTTKPLSISVVAGDTNQAVLDKMAKSINTAKAGVTANVVKDVKTGTSQLVVTANETGTAKAFTINDAVGSSAVVNTGIGTVSRASADAKYTVNGAAYTSGKNTVTLTADPKVSLTLSGIVTGAKITVENNTDAITGAVTKFTDSYNKMVEYLSKNEQYINPVLANKLKQAFTSHAGEFKNAGITANLDGTLAVDQAALQKSVKLNPTGLEYALGGVSGTAKLSQSLADRVLSSASSAFAKPLNPLSYFSAYNSSSAIYQQWFPGTIINRLF